MVSLRPAVPALVTLLALAASDGASPFADLNLEAHGFASFGHLRTWGNNWLGSTVDGTSEFWEAAANVVARPVDRLRLGAQVFARDLGRYDNGQPQLDWAYADWRAADACGVQAGRIKLPIGLWNEVLDVDAARTPAFLPPAIYALRSRDLYISTDGAKLYGLLPVPGGSLEYQAFAGRKDFDEDMGFASYFRELGLGERIESIEVGLLFGGTLRWDTPCHGLALQASFADAHGFAVHGAIPSLGATTTTRVPDYLIGVASILYERGDWTFATEYSRLRGRGETSIAPFGLSVDLREESEMGYASAVWHWRPWLEWYAAWEFAWAEAGSRQDDYRYSAVLAANLMPLDHWSLKAEFRDNWGTLGVTAADEPDGADSRWQLLALKTTVDF